MVLSLLCSTQEINGVPIFPARIVAKSALLKMCSINEVVVVFPFDPVMPIKRPFKNRAASSISLQMVTPPARAVCRMGASAGTPGLGMTKSVSSSSSSLWPASWRETPAARSGAMELPNSVSARVSVAVTRAPRAAQKIAVATPVLDSPTTSTRLFRSSMAPGISLNDLLPQCQSRKCEQRKNQSRDPKAHDHFGFAPTQQFKMVMNGGHAKNALAAQLERTHLQNDRESLDDKNPAYKEQQNLLFDNDGYRTQRPSQRQ